MALYEDHLWVDTATFLAALVSFATSNGWTEVESDTTHFKISKNGLEWHVWSIDSAGFQMTATIDGVTSPTTYFYRFDSANGDPATFMACGNGLAVYSRRYYNSTNYWIAGGIFNITKKIGVWNGGPIIHGGYSTSSTNGAYFLQSGMSNRATLWYEGAWTTLGVAEEGRVRGSSNQSATIHIGPNFFNAVNTPNPIMAYLFNADTTYYHPIGIVDEVAIFAGGDIYQRGDVVTINGQDWYFNSEVNCIFKLS